MTPTSLQVTVDRDPERTARALGARLAARYPERAAGLRVHPPSPVVGAGSANETLVARVDGLDGDGPTSVVVRVVVPASQVFPGTSVARQAAALRHVAAHCDVPVPAVLDVDPDGEALGAPMMILERLPGRAPLDFPSWAVEGFVADMTAADRRALWSSALDVLARLAAVDVTGLVLPGLPGVDGDVVGERVEYLRRYRDVTLADAPPDPLVDDALAVLADTAPAHPPPGLSWGDARLGNMLFAGTRVSAVLDWEIVTVAGPLFDLAWWRMFDHVHVEDLAGARPEGIGDPAETAAAWSTRTGLGLDDLPWHELYVHLHLAMVRHRAFADRAAMGRPVPGPDDPRHVDRLLERVRRLLDDRSADRIVGPPATTASPPRSVRDGPRRVPGDRRDEAGVFAVDPGPTEER
ncbi:phosphotransferase family protein [Actinomycetospora sp. TBRC 11914]|uniref:phosphotransferase family protein n=1 Tax=Actinomycetospora sp. TBRC 11914 TaxID=2729387 RepID=UPI00145E2F79|nr:phosphotransferase family protein [Actinomycetospora sp. TBRC 11914]NMO91600.1 phosphotransferase family protein [Actinomycetospora sp. TBRC 11914]